MHPRERLIQFGEKRRDPRNKEIKQKAELVRAKFNDLFDEALGHIVVELPSYQSEQLFPGAQDAEPITVDLAQMAPDGYAFRCGLNREGSEIIFSLIGSEASISSLSKNPNPKHILDTVRTIDFSNRGMDKRDQQLQALRFGERIAEVLLEAREMTPNRFTYI